MESIVPRVDTQNTRSLTNFEVFEFMKARMESKNKVRAQQTLLYTGLKFFQEKSPCTTQTPQQIANFLEKIKTCKLKKEEVLALINNCPVTQVELSVLIPDLDSQFTPAQTDKILALVAECFPEGVKRSVTINSSGVAEESTD
uniref:DNA-directed RNA polymerase III subunit RPC9 n=1 Tax=Schistocephalus solidus TaxID=70667 RepID=A0A0X3PIT0_SCHSO